MRPTFICYLPTPSAVGRHRKNCRRKSQGISSIAARFKRAHNYKMMHGREIVLSIFANPNGHGLYPQANPFRGADTSPPSSRQAQLTEAESAKSSFDEPARELLIGDVEIRDVPQWSREWAITRRADQFQALFPVVEFLGFVSDSRDNDDGRAILLIATRTCRRLRHWLDPSAISSATQQTQQATR